MIIEYRRNRSLGGYEHERVAIKVDTDEMSMTPDEAMLMVRGMVQATLGEKVDDIRKVRKLYNKAYGENAEFDDLRR